MKLNRMPEELLPAIYDVAIESCRQFAAENDPEYWKNKIDQIKQEALWQTAFYINGDQMAKWINRKCLSPKVR
ncbi:hypothetical protein TRFO_41067 [Tritrichomonas foetus]|uniref:Uncharacterized protein n=1 Tax=Tritrichomonas foetus TaxID=1144522 RepID=A0A1J4L1Q6_9EUKA|nr:hypothetical protein TRFO_41067 [Tritrichomonas foetus]|eukprot:OHT17371.1 hypothetical protein TRFO_41067 [Tritrichomonas foetus]